MTDERNPGSMQQTLNGPGTSLSLRHSSESADAAWNRFIVFVTEQVHDARRLLDRASMCVGLGSGSILGLLFQAGVPSWWPIVPGVLFTAAAIFIRRRSAILAIVDEAFVRVRHLVDEPATPLGKPS